MRFRLVLLAAFLTTSLTALAAKRFSEDELKQLLLSAQVIHRTDDAVAQQLADVKLANRLSGTDLQQFLAMSPGPKSTEALHVIADASAFLAPPAGQLPATPAPDIATQKAIIARTIDYVAHTMPLLPNFLATRVTESYVDSLRGIDQAQPERGGLYLLGTSSAPIGFSDGRETDDLTKAARSSGVPGMTSWGEFGPILGVVLLDAAKGKLSWARWELEDGKPAAVFQFVVDRSISHYQLNYCCDRTGVSASQMVRGGIEGALKVVTWKPGYHGLMELDPETGAVLRITIKADLRPDDMVERASMMVEYGQVKIGSGVYLCPTRSVAVSVSSAEIEDHGAVEHMDRMLLNDVEFTDYHRFGSEARVFTNVAQNEAPAASAASTAAGPAPSADKAGPAPASPVPAPAPVKMAAAAPPPVPQPAPRPQPVPVDTDKEIQTSDVGSIPGIAGASANGSAQAPGNADSTNITFKAETRLVDVGLVADDHRGKPVTDLKEGEIEIFDNGRKQQLRVFSHETAAMGAAVTTAAETAQASTSSDIFSNATYPAEQLQLAPDLFILLLDESHLPFQDLNRARAEVLRFLAASRPDSRIALYAISERGFHVIQDVTQDRELVEKKLSAWIPDAGALAQAATLERRNRQQFDTVHNTQDLSSVNGNEVDEPQTMQATDPELREMGDNPLGYALEGMTALARHFASVPGHKSIAWISGDSVLFDWQDQAVGKDKGSKQIEAALQHTQEALNDAHMSLYAVDASAVETSAVDASLQFRNIELNPVDQNGPPSASSPRNESPGRIKAEMLQDTHAIQTPIRQLADSTGGRAINKGGDLKATLESIDRDSSSYYELGFSPDTAADGKYHTLQIKVPTRKNVVLRYRTGYLYSEETASTGQRFQQAVWSPQDATDVEFEVQAVTAEDSPASKSGIRLRIGFPGLSFKQNAGRWNDQLYIFIAERDDATEKAEVSGETLRLSLKQATYDSGMPSGIPYQCDVETKFKLGSVRILVIDGNSGRMGSVTVPASALHP
jgi:VWFA-related protein